MVDGRSSPGLLVKASGLLASGAPLGSGGDGRATPGPIEVRLDGRPIELGPRKQRAVLAMLALQSGRTVSTDRIVDGLWGDEPGFGAPDPARELRAHATAQGWNADYLAPSTFIETNFTCAAMADRGGLNFSRLCDSTLERRIGRALALPPAEAAAAWAAADHRLTELAAAVPMTQRRAVVLVSRRVGNVQDHAQLFTLLDQLWVK